MIIDDSELEQVLKENSVVLKASELHAIIAGIAAAPLSVAIEELSWISLITTNPSQVLKEILIKLYNRARSIVFNYNSNKLTTAERLFVLRAELARRNLYGFIVPSSDEHQGEYVAYRATRLKWLTNFTGSTGLAVVLKKRAAILVDGRYILQVEKESRRDLFQYLNLDEASLKQWLIVNSVPGCHIGYDPWLHTLASVQWLERITRSIGIYLEACEVNPIDTVWQDQPPDPLAPVLLHPLKYTGESSIQKRFSLARALVKAKVDAVVLSALDSIAWLLNIRGGDIPYTPLPLAFAILYANAKVDLFIDKRKLTLTVFTHLVQEGVQILPPSSFQTVLNIIGKHGASVLLDKTSTPIAVSRSLHTTGAHIKSGLDPCTLPKACKNQVELNGMRLAHRRDGVTLVRFFHWLETMIANDYSVTELIAANYLESLRRESQHFRCTSFETISAAGPNGAIVHYHPTLETDCLLRKGSLYLIDTGAQYLDGTTDITRTIALGASSTAEQRLRFTQVLKGHIALATATFPTGTTGSQLDVLARQALWADSQDYAHGTGHGVGSYLKVHEGPQRITTAASTIALSPGMILSNEPAFYKAGSYGIRIENLLAVGYITGPPTESQTSQLKFLGFEVLTLAPIDYSLIEISLLSSHEKNWMNSYHRRVRNTLIRFLDRTTAKWLEKATAPL